MNDSVLFFYASHCAVGPSPPLRRRGLDVLCMYVYKCVCTLSGSATQRLRSFEVGVDLNTWQCKRTVCEYLAAKFESPKEATLHPRPVRKVTRLNLYISGEASRACIRHFVVCICLNLSDGNRMERTQNGAEDTTKNDK